MRLASASWLAAAIAIVVAPALARADDVVAAPSAAADASALVSSRVLVADTDAELLRAIASSLAPWRLIVIAEHGAGDGEGEGARATDRAVATHARFVVWREHDELVVVDRARGTTERRPVSPGPLDPVHAAAAALTVKTMMRLPADPALLPAEEPEEPEEPGEPEHRGAETTGAAGELTASEAPVAAGGLELRLQAGVAGRLARGSQVDLGARGALAVLVRPSARRPWRLGLAVELGPGEEVSQSGFKGTWRDGSIAAVASWTHDHGRYELEPWLAAGLVHLELRGTEMMRAREESATRPLVRLGVTARRKVHGWSLGVYLAGESTLGTPSYTKQVGSSSNPIFEMPGIAAIFGVVVAADLGR